MMVRGRAVARTGLGKGRWCIGKVLGPLEAAWKLHEGECAIEEGDLGAARQAVNRLQEGCV